MIDTAGQDRRFGVHLPWVALVVSALLHSLILVFSNEQKPPSRPPTQRIEASLARPTPPNKPVETTPQPVSPSKASKPRPERKILAVDQGKTRPTRQPTPKFSAAEKAEMDNFLDELQREKRPPPTLAERSRDAARKAGRDIARQDEAAREVVDRLPNSPEPDPFSLEMYLDAVVKKLNRSAAFVRNDPRAKGVRAALVRVQLNPNGSLRRFEIINAADQQDEIAFVRSVVEQAVPFSAFPADLQRSARSLGILICIQPPSALGGGFGFSRSSDQRGCR